MTTYTLASTFTLTPSDLQHGEYHRASPDTGVRNGRAIWIDPVAGTVQVTVRGTAHGAEIFLRLPPAPLPELAGLLGTMVSLLNFARPYLRVIETPDAELPAYLQLDEVSVQVMLLIEKMVDTLWRRWTGHGIPANSRAHCRWCQQPIVHASRPGPADEWFVDDSPSLCELSALVEDCPSNACGVHEPYAAPHPYSAQIDLRPNHHPAYTEYEDGTWSGTCCCGRWDARSAETDTRELVNGYLEHGEQAQVPPGAPFDVPQWDRAQPAQSER